MNDLERAELAEFDPPAETIEPERLTSPLVFSSPHSGQRYPDRFLEASRLDPLTLRRSEDSFVDELFLPCVALGAPMLRAVFPRAYLDVNREPYELDPKVFDGPVPDYANTRSLRVAVGLGTIPRVVGDAQPIYKQPLPVGVGLARIEVLYRPYHARLEALVARARKRFGRALLIDCHSMPSNAADVGGWDIVLGDRFGASAASIVIETLETSLRDSGYRVRRNKPFAGGYITEHFGAPAEGVHAVQIEIARAIYMDERRIVRNERWSRLSHDLFAAARALDSEFSGARSARLAAE
ncbi:N-formylglutamate amidohydrolase [Roseiarcus fermentans]|uniref:N-formylglutamate amidohydrolase n=1 Tax=Roseiarcus fermentans TaxID=1473586 RepID=A0A366FM45_9HYPH|nr:N-formylglutamate amidohydrolase [Roseiarcus fermentans]RBP15764.1 N-formylglutamate amidohydrolase [Roseiarcus fermentans]